jgi:hypothetical protein
LSLKAFRIPSSIRRISKTSFVYCKNLSTLIFERPYNNALVAEFLFSDCPSPGSMWIPSPVETPSAYHLCRSESVPSESDSRASLVDDCALWVVRSSSPN